jgi:hypothetical protein
MVAYFSSAIAGTERSRSFAALMLEEGFHPFEECKDEFWKLFR